MNAVGRIGSYLYRGVGTVSGPFHPFGGAVDIIVVEQPDGTFKSSPWYVRFGKFQGVLKNKRNVIKIDVNDAAAGFNMYLDHTGQAYFLREVDDVVEEGDAVVYPLSSGDEVDSKYCNMNEIGTMKSKSCDYDDGNGNMVGKPGIFGFVFGRRSVRENRFNEEEGVGSSVTRASSLERAEIAADLLEVKWSTNLNSPLALKDKSRVENGGMQRRANGSLRVNPEISVGETSLEEAESSSSCDGEPGQDRSEGECVAPSETLVESNETPVDIQNDDCFSGNHSTLEATSSLEVSPNLEFVDEKEQDYHENIKVLQRREISDQKSASSTVESPVLCEVSGISVLADGGSYEATTLSLDPCEVNGEINGYSEPNITAQPLAQDMLAEYSVEFQQELLDAPEPVDHILCNYATLSSAEEVDLGNIGTSHERNTLSLQDADNNVMDNGHHSAGTGEKPKSTSVSNILQSESLEEEQFGFSDLDESKPGGTVFVASIFPDIITVNEKEIYEENGTDCENPVEKSNALADPIKIHGDDECTVEEKRLVESLPNMWSHSADSYANHFRPLSQSLGPNSESLKWGFRKDKSYSENSDADKWNRHQLASEGKNNVDSLDSKAFECVLANPQVVELSLCKPLLSEGMGAEAASHVFNSKKLDADKFASLGPSIVQNKNLVIRIGGCYFPWDAAAPIILGMASFGTDKIFEPKGMIAVDQIMKSGDVALGGGNWMLWPFSRTRSTKDGKIQDSSRGVTENEEKYNGGSKPNKVKKMVRALTPTSDQLASLNLKDGRNSVTFTFSTNMLGMQQVDARIYLWKSNARIVISDVDGTITKSDVLGQFMPLVGIDWSQTGVTHLFSAIKDNGYHLIFLSARAISQASVTRQFLVNLKQDGKALPDGPVVISPDGLFPSLFREVIRRAPHEFKIACLEEIRALFPQENNPFYAGFGNRDTDEISYLKVGIPRGKIFIINPRGEVAVNRSIDTRSYTSLRALVNGMFPATTIVEREDFNTWNFWKLPPPLIDV